MDYFIEFLKAILYSLVEGFTQIVPISSSAHFKFFNAFLPVSEGVELLFIPLVQLFALLGAFLFFIKLVLPKGKKALKKDKRDVKNLWINILIATIPTFILYILFDIFLAKYLGSFFIHCMMLLIYGVVFLILEYFVLKEKTALKQNSIYEITKTSAFLIGISQVMAFVPGSSRLAVTIIAALLLGFTRSCSFSFSFIIGFPLIFLESLYKVISVAVQGDFLFSGPNTLFLVFSCIFVFLFTFFIFRFVHRFYEKYTFKSVGYYRILAGILFLLLFFYVLY